MESTDATMIGTVPLADAKRVIEAAEREAEVIGQPMCIAVVDAGANLVAFSRMDGAWLGSADIAINKAFTARAFDMPTGQLSRFARADGQAFGIHVSNGGRVIIFAGGFPLKDADGRVVGAVGVSGGVGDQDDAVAEAGIAAFEGRGR